MTAANGFLQRLTGWQVMDISEASKKEAGVSKQQPGRLVSKYRGGL